MPTRRLRDPIPAWKRLLYLDCIAIRGKGDEIFIPGWGVLGIVITSPLWCWCFLPAALRYARDCTRHKIEDWRRRPYGGFNVSEANTARPSRLFFWRWRPHRRNLRCLPVYEAQSESRLLSLPYELREQIWLELLRPSDRLHIDYDYQTSRLCATPINEGQYIPQISTCNTLAPLLRVNRALHEEASRVLYEANTFHFRDRTRLPTRQDKAAALFAAFTHSILPEHVDQIRKLSLKVEFAWSYNSKRKLWQLAKRSERTWSLMCRTLKGMQSLRRLRIEVGRCLYSWTTQGGGTTTGDQHPSMEDQTPENKVLAELIGVRAAEEFVVAMPWPEDVRGELRGAAFTLKLIEQAPGWSRRT